ncbi:hypothetical protein WA026_004357 [Henosepilachna vigintioctopunctata]|uniref:Protein naked cuticle homolog n=1 Tax=Henosepilachna vigintioctopunctata TaxID=420089 RepID=A0AAW1V7U7_9CUCU
MFKYGFTILDDCGDVKVSDTEELLGRNDSEDENFDRIRTCQTPTCQEGLKTSLENEEHPPESPRQINLEEFFCDVSMENGDPPGQEKQEFSFTLYDFDGHGKITKDDIAGLVTTIYEALGSSIKVPHYGSKTIKVKLTVSPEQRCDGEKHSENNKHSNIRYKKDINVTIRQGSEESRRYCKSNCRHRRKLYCCKRNEENRRNSHCCKKEEETEEQHLISDDFSDACSRVSSGSSSDDECEVDQCSDQENGFHRVRQKKYTKRNPRRYTIPTLFLKDIYKHRDKCSKNKKERNRSSSLQRQELLEIIQANMEKNNLGFQTIGKQCTPQEPAEVKSPATEPSKQHKHKVTTKTESSSPLHHYFANMVDPTQFYVDLASLQNATQLPTNYKYDKLIDAVIGVSNRKNPMNSRGKHRKANNVKTECENAAEYQVDAQVNDDAAKTTPAKKCVERTARKNSKKSHAVTGHTSSPHYLKHRNRQEDQARAMAQVVRWLEQEFSSNLTMKDKWTKHTGGFNSEKESANNANNSNIERHEHHHVHEHIHHHYHHYQNAPFVV